MTLEYCIECDEATGHAGKHDDSLYLESGAGPFCDHCYDHLRVEELENEIDRLQAENATFRAAQAECSKCDEFTDELGRRYDRLQAKLEKLIPYLQHDGDCDLSSDTLYRPVDCDCGLSALMEDKAND